MRAFRVTFRISCLVFILVLTACGGGSGSAPTPPPPAPLGVQLSANTVTALPDGTPAPVTVTVTQPSGDSGAVTLSATSLPTGVTAQIASPSSGSPGTVTFTAQTTAIAGSYTVGIGASDSVTSGGATLTLVVGIVATVGAAVDTSSGVNGQLNLFMSTSFGLASWADQFFVTNPDATQTQNHYNVSGWSVFATYKIQPEKFVVFARYDSYQPKSTDSSRDMNIIILGFDWYAWGANARLQPNIWFYSYKDSTKKSDIVASLTFFMSF
jgi:hypothetical protein